MNEQHIGFILWVCLYPVSVAVIRYINRCIRKATPIPIPSTPQDLEKIKRNIKNQISAGCMQMILYWVVAYMLW